MKRRDFLRYSLAGGAVLAQPQLVFATTETYSFYNPTRYIFITDRESPFITVFNVFYGKYVGSLNFDMKPEVIELSRDDSMMVVGNTESTELILYDLQTRMQRVLTLPSPIHRAFFIPQSKLVAIAMREHLGMVNYESGELLVYPEPYDVANRDSANGQHFQLLFSSFTRTYWVLDGDSPRIYRKSAYDPEDTSWEAMDFSERLGTSLGFEDGLVTPGNYLMALTAKQGNEGYAYFIEEDKLLSTGPMGAKGETGASMLRPYIDSSFKRVLFADTGGNIALFNFDKSEEAEHYKVDFSPQHFRTGWLESTLIIAGDKGLQFQSFDDLDDKKVFELPSGVVDTWVSGDGKILYLTLEEGEPQVLRYDIRRREPLEPILVHGVMSASALRMGSSNSICF